MRVKDALWKPLQIYKDSAVEENIGSEMGPLVDVPAMVRIENEKWVFERVSQETLTHLTHRLVVHEVEGPRTLGATMDLKQQCKSLREWLNRWFCSSD